MGRNFGKAFKGLLERYFGKEDPFGGWVLPPLLLIPVLLSRKLFCNIFSLKKEVFL